MEQSKINKAYPALMRLCELRLPIKKAREVYNLSKRTGQHFEFALAEERKCVDECNGKVNMDGTVSFNNADDYAAFRKRIDELNSSEVDLVISPIVIFESELENQTISPADIHDLEDFVIFD